VQADRFKTEFTDKIPDMGFTALKYGEAKVYLKDLGHFKAETLVEALENLVRKGAPKTLKLPDVLAECRLIEPPEKSAKDDARHCIRAPESYRRKMREMRGGAVEKQQPNPARTAAAIMENTRYALTESAKITGKPAPEPREIITAAVRFAEQSAQDYESLPDGDKPHNGMNAGRLRAVLADLRTEYAKYPDKPKSGVPTVTDIAAEAGSLAYVPPDVFSGSKNNIEARTATTHP